MALIGKDEIDRKFLRELYVDKKKTIRQIAKETGYSYTYICRRLHRLHICRTQSEGQKGRMLGNTNGFTREKMLGNTYGFKKGYIPWNKKRKENIA